MEDRSHALAAGIFTLVMAIALAISVWWLNGSKEETRDINLVASGSINGLNTQAQVRFRGLRVGKVQDIRIDSNPPYRILVRVKIARTVPVSVRTTAQLNTQGVTGLASVQLDDDGTSSDAPRLGQDGLPLIDLRSSSLDSLGSTANDLAIQVKVMAGRLNRLLSEENVSRVERTLGHVEGAAAGLNRSLADAPAVLADLRRLVNEDNIRRLNSTLSNLEKASGEAPALVLEGRRALVGLQTASQRIDALGRDVGGEVGQSTLPRLNRLLQDLSANSRQLSRVLDQLERSPQSILFGRELPPGPGESGWRDKK